ncbi:hypothetical protein Gocc_2661 [Gaiella occulta]|uniref:Uncharacterized protein n=1 Tax=Gaiella occulta TaxID=1002870 RepID=A0A7M2YUW4_9ACTN|nr:hypothetical protein [Gaiella occulta]RDI73520.1 hypothetical protein Gocc_2661 [Gaiella occulta]
MTKAQEVYDRVEALVASGVRKADAFRQVADEFGQPFNSMRGAYYAHTRTSGQSTPRSRKREAANGDPIEQATSVLTRAVESIDAEVAAAKTRVDEAKTEYEHLRDTAAERKANIQVKIDALKA